MVAARLLLQDLWARRSAVSAVLLPLALLFAGLSGLRRIAYRRGWLASQRMPVPVLVIGNILVGGTGKTPLAIALIASLREHGFCPGVVSRGYGGAAHHSGAAFEVTSEDAQRFGDEIVLIRQRTGVPAVTGARRTAAARLLLERHPEVDVIVCDDGLQHYALARDLELVVFDGRGVGNGWLLPAGPLREGQARLAHADAIVMNGSASVAPSSSIPSFYFETSGESAYLLTKRDQTQSLTEFRDKRVLAAAGIGEPDRFFRMLRGQGLTLTTLALPDHFDYRQNPFASSDAEFILITEKDAVKCRGLADPRLWVVPLSVRLGPGLEIFVVEKLRASKYHRPATA